MTLKPGVMAAENSKYNIYKYIILYIKYILIETRNCNNISLYYCFYCNFEQIRAALASIRENILTLNW